MNEKLLVFAGTVLLFFVILALLVAVAVRIAYFVLVNKPALENREIKAEQTERTANEVVVQFN